MINGGGFCDLYRPVYTSRLDTPETVRQITQNNAVWVSLCERGGLK